MRLSQLNSGLISDHFQKRTNVPGKSVDSFQYFLLMFGEERILDLRSSDIS